MRIVFREKSLWDSSNGIRKWDWLLIIGLTIAPMTGLRIWKVGPGEVFCLLWGLKYLISTRFSINDISCFFLGFIALMCLGSIMGYLIAPNELRISNLLTWVYLGVIAMAIYNGLKKNTMDYNEHLYIIFAVFSTVWYAVLFLYSRHINKTFFGVSLWYSNRRFSGGGENPHQVAVLLCALCFVFLRRFLARRNKLISALGLSVCIMLTIATESSTAILAITIGLIVSVYLYISRRFHSRRAVITVVFTAILLSIILIGFRWFTSLILQWISEDSNGLGRLSIFSSFPDMFRKSPLVGLGPGVHGKNGSIEFHNMYLEVLAASGIIGGIILLLFSVRVFRKTLITDWSLLPIILSMYAYGLAGFAMRRLVFWGITTFVIVLSEQRLEKKSRQSHDINLACYG